MSNNTIEIKINSGGTLEVVTIPVKLYKDSYNAVKLRVKAPKVEGAILKVYGSDRDEAGEEVWTTSAHTLSWKEYVVINSQDYSVYEDYIPEEFCQKNGELYLTFGLGMMDGESWTAILTSGTLNLYVSGEGFNFAGVEIPESDKLAYKINKTFENYERLSEDIERIDQLADDIENVVGVSQDALSKAEEALVKVQDANDTKVFVGGVKVDEFNADTKANVSDLEEKVDKVIGKGLSTYDFDDVAKGKLDGIQAGANKTIVDSVLSKTSTNPVQNKVIAEALENISTGGADLSNYYTKDETYSKTEVDKKIEDIQTGGSGDLSDYLSVKGGEMSGDILFKSGNVKFQKTENGMTTNYTMLGEDYVGSNANPLEIRGTEITFKNRPTVNGTEVATVDDIPSGTGTSIVVDSELSETSENPVQNKVITNKLNSLIGGSKNLLSLVGSETRTFSGLTISRNNCEFVFSGNDPNNVTELFQLNSPVLLKAGESYTFSVTKVSGTMSKQHEDALRAGLRDINGNTIVGGYDVDADEEKRVITPSADVYAQTLVVFASQWATFNNYTIAFQLEEGDQKTNYEPYGGGLLSKEDIQPHIITGRLLAPYYPQADSTYHTLPLVEYNKTGTKLTLNADGRVVIGKGVSKVKASGTAFMHYGNTSKYHLTACIRKNTTNIVPMLIESSNLYPNVATTLASAPVLIDVTEGDMIDLGGRCNIGSGAFINGLNNQLVTYLTVEVVE